LLSNESSKVELQHQLYTAFRKAQTKIQDCKQEDTRLVAFALDLCAEFLTSVSLTQTLQKDLSANAAKELVAFSPM
jgi:hypothetical protein